ncbi:23S rRNA (pseudouridine(1915)-N(3))-methyltransferase RlmH [Futiania mangrovi]|uniref:Ribosomal RNA large subunit methyltransferase H n=1 Tax=Futiania mangrovi TaxID=2959716 RepID=A0A9J6PFY0_9PROT|nr:23S rRNA (pseudouridine(1915)-N(3))-methyltransferase RlmH [Futiania mangrovii]MCP1336707.1 23S rRNA (pseudouridine(1915)-N(3))-methyltransferase RlmH [Futiania mangrovii]
MRLTVTAVGRLRRGPERELVDDYRARADAAGRAVGLFPVSVQEIDAKGGAEGEAQALLASLPPDTALIALDERGTEMSSEAFSALLADWRDAGRRDCVLMIGGADGFDRTVRDRADRTLAFGKMTWPHMMVRVMALEQIYRAITILSGHPYHRGG